MREVLTSIGEVIGVGTVVAGVWLIYIPAALIVAGLGLILLCYGATRKAPAS